MLKNKKIVETEKDLKIFDIKGQTGVTAIFNLYNTYWWKSLMAPFFMFIFPIVIFGILGNLMNSTYMFGGAIAMTAMTAGVLTLPWNILELKQSVLLKRVGASPVKTWQFTFAIVLHTIFTAFLAIGWLFIFTLIIFQDVEMLSFFTNAERGAGVLFGIFILLLISISIGFIIASITKTQMSATTIGLLFFLPAGFLSGQWISIDIISQTPAMNYLSMVFPFRYPTMFIINSVTPNIDGIFQISNVVGAAQTSTQELMNMIAKDEMPDVLKELGLVSWSNIGITSIEDFYNVVGDKTNVHGQILNGFYQDEGVAKGYFFSSEILYQSYEYYIAYTYPILLSGILIGVSSKVFKWSGSR